MTKAEARAIYNGSEEALKSLREARALVVEVDRDAQFPESTFGEIVSEINTAFGEVERIRDMAKEELAQ
jgi:hypothetical protein